MPKTALRTSCPSPARRSLALLIGLGLAGSVLAGCPIEPPICTLESVASLSVGVSDESGAAVEGTTVRFAVDGGEFEDCDDFSDRWTCGWEIAGDFDVEISAPGFETRTESLVIEADECHVIGQILDVTLSPLDCTGVEVPSLIVSLLDQGDTPLSAESGAWATWGLAAADMDPVACEPYESDRFLCGWNMSGLFEINVGRIGYYTAAETIAVAFDGCHPITEEIEISLINATIPCTEEVVPSLDLSVVDANGQPIEGADATYNSAYVDALLPSPCYDLGGGVFQCGSELAGAINIDIQAPGYSSWSGQAYVTTDACHVITESVTATLESAS